MMPHTFLYILRLMLLYNRKPPEGLCCTILSTVTPKQELHCMMLTSLILHIFYNYYLSLIFGTVLRLLSSIRKPIATAIANPKEKSSCVSPPPL